MALVSDSIADEVLSVFVNSNRTEMTLIELQEYLNNQLTNDEVLRQFSRTNLANLFELQSISNQLCLVKLNPKLPLCESCLQKGCKNKRNCTQLHLCRYLSHFTHKPLDKPCQFPHQLTDLSQNVLLLKQYNYETLNEDLLLKLLRLHYENCRRSKPISDLKKSPIFTDNVLERQLDIVIPSENEANNIDIEIVQLLLATREIIVEEVLSKEISTEFYRRYTLQFPNKDIIENLLKTEPIIVYNDIPIKMKRTQRYRDSKIIALKFLTENKIDQIRLNLYVETLVGKDNANTIFNMTPEGNQEQIYLIRCEQTIDFEHLYKVHSAKNTLQGYQVLITEVYKTESLEITFLNKSHYRPLTFSRLRQLIGEKRWQDEVFACLAIRDGTSADIELINSEITSKWLSEAAYFEKNFSLRIHPIVDFIPTNEEKISSNQQNFLYTIKPTWRIVLTHPNFGDEYRKYIRKHLNISIQIVGSTIQLPNDHLRQELARYTNMFIQNFVFHELNNLDKNQVKIVKENYSRMAHKWQSDTKTTLIAARRDVINEILPRLQSTVPRSTTNTPVFRSKQTKITTDDTCQTLPYTIENSIYFPFFSSTNSFPERLRVYLLNTFRIQLNIHTNSSTRILLELKGQSKDLSDVRAILSALFASLKVKTYSDTQFSIPDIASIAQWNLNQSSIVSSCNFSMKNGGCLSVRYFADHPQFGVDEQQIDDILLQKIFYQSIPIKVGTFNLETQLQNLLKQWQQRPNYGEQICFVYHQTSSIKLAGTKPIVLQIENDLQKIIDEYTPVSCQMFLQTNQMKYLIHLCSNELMKYEKTYENDGVDLRTKFKNEINEFLAPKYLHEKLKLLLLEMCQIQTISKDFRCSSQIIKNKRTELNNLAIKHRCLLTIHSKTTNPSKIHSGSIHISNGDLTTEPSDVLVICSTSVQLRQIVIKSAGKEIEQKIHGIDLTKTIFDTSAGQLQQAKRLLFIPWTPPSAYSQHQDIDALRRSIVIFIQQAMNFTFENRFRSIAFHAIGCGGFGIPADLIATIMIDSVQDFLTTNPALQLKITFVVKERNVFDQFQAKLQSRDTSTSEKITINLETAVSNIETAKNLLTTIANTLT